MFLVNGNYKEEMEIMSFTEIQLAGKTQQSLSLNAFLLFSHLTGLPVWLPNFQFNQLNWQVQSGL